MDPWMLFFSALGLAIVLEGLPYFVSPAGVRRYLAFVQTLGDGTLRLMGLALTGIGLLLLLIARAVGSP